LTALAFVATLNIHPLMAYLVGLSAIAASLVRSSAWQSVAGVLLGIGLIFFGLETMGESARPLVATDWFQDLPRQTVASPAVAFVAGVAIAALLQSNTASTLLVITLAGVGAFDLGPAMMLIRLARLLADLAPYSLKGPLPGTEQEAASGS
jgi:phosphate:Na+ symporter